MKIERNSTVQHLRVPALLKICVKVWRYSFLIAATLISAGCTNDDSTIENQIKAKYLIDLGTIQLKTFPKDYLIQHKFKLRNSTDQSIRLDDFTRSCSCVEFMAPPEVASGEEFEVTIRFDGRALAETRREHVKFTTGNPRLPTLTLAVHCNTVPNAMLEPNDTFNLEIEQSEVFEISGVYTAFVSTSDAKTKTTASALADEQLEVFFGKRGVAQIGDNLWAVRTPWSIRPSKSFAIPPGVNDSFRILFSSFAGCDKNVTLHVSHRSVYQVSPTQLFLPRELEAEIRVKIENALGSDISEIAVDGNLLDQSEWSVISVDDAAIISINQVAVRSAYGRKHQDSQPSQLTLELRLKEGIASIAVHIF